MNPIVATVVLASTCQNLLLEPRKALTWETNQWVSGEIDPGIAWVDVVPSWDVEGTESGGHVEVKIERGGEKYSFGPWSLKGRTSIENQKGSAGALYTDTFVPSVSGGGAKFTVTLVAGPGGEMPRLRWLRLAFSAGKGDELPWRGEAIEALAVPIRAQGDYPGGNVLCSPTSVSMVLNYWAKQLNRPLLDADVPIVQACVHDVAWKGTGNWAFNTAFATTRPGLSAYVARLANVNTLEEWLKKGVPVITSVSYGLLKGKPARDDNDGHLVVAVGVDRDGNIVFNDPGKKPNRLTYGRQAFERAWAVSNNTVYLIHPDRWDVPAL